MKKRIAIFVFFDNEGIVSEYVDYLLECLMNSIDELVVVCNGKCNNTGRNIFKQYTDEVYVRDNVGLDAGAYKQAILEYVGWDRLCEYEELLLLNDTFFGPLYPFDKIFNEMEKRNVDFWGITLQRETESSYGMVPENIQSYFLSFNSNVINSNAFHSFWEEMPIPKNFVEDCMVFENSLTGYLSKHGFSYDVLVNSDYYNEDFENINPVFFVPYSSIMYQNMPFLKIKPFEAVYSLDKEQSELYLALKYIDEETSYDIDMIYSHLLRKKSIDSLMYSMGLCSQIQRRHVNKMHESKVGVICFVSREKSVLYLKRRLENLKNIKICIMTNNKMLYLDLAETLNGVAIVYRPGASRHSALFQAPRDYLYLDYVIYIHDGVINSKMKGYVSCFSNLQKNIDILLGDDFYINDIVTLMECEKKLGIVMTGIPGQSNYCDIYMQLVKYRNRNKNVVMKNFDIKKLDRNHFDYIISENGVCIRATILRRVMKEINAPEIEDVVFLSLPQIVQRYGYYTRHVFTEMYAIFNKKNYELLMREALNAISNYGFSNLPDFIRDWRLLRICSKIMEAKDIKKIYMYGAGIIAKRLYEDLYNKGIFLDGFIVSSNIDEREIFGIPVYIMGEFIFKDTDLIVVGMNEKNQKEVLPNLLKCIDKKRIIVY